MQVWRSLIQIIQDYLFEIFKWMLMALIIGVMGGLLGVLFHHGLTEASGLRTAHAWLLYLLPLLGMVIIFLYHRMGMRTDRGTNRVLDSVRKNEPIPLRVGVLMFISTILTQLGGGSAGREGAALQIGGSIGSFFSHKAGARIKLPEHSQRVGVMCGMSAVFSALFGTPLTATIFSIEVAEVGLMDHLGLFPCLLSSLIAFWISQSLGGERTFFYLSSQIEITSNTYGKVIVLAFLCAFVSILFCFVMHQARPLYNRITRNSYLRVLLGGGIVVLVSVLLGSTEFNGAGMNIVENAISGHADWYTFLLKMLLTAVTLGAGFKGGEIVPSFAVGASFGCAAATVLGLDPTLSAALGLVAVFCGVVNCPFTSILLSLELFGNDYLVLFVMVCAVSLLFSGSCSLYSSQRILNDKFDVIQLIDWKRDEKISLPRRDHH